MGYGTWPTAIVVDGNKAVTIAEVPVPDGLALGWETCRTCHGTGLEPCDRKHRACSAAHMKPCPACLGGLIRFPVWLRECDNPNHLVRGKDIYDPAEHVLRVLDFTNAPSGCVDVGGRRMIPVRNGEQT